MKITYEAFIANPKIEGKWKITQVPFISDYYLWKILRALALALGLATTDLDQQINKIKIDRRMKNTVILDTNLIEIPA